MHTNGAQFIIGPPRLLFGSFARATRQTALALFSLALLLAGVAQAVRAQSALDGFDPNANGAVRVVLVQPDGKILIGGDFTSLAPNGGTAASRATASPGSTRTARSTPPSIRTRTV